MSFIEQLHARRKKLADVLADEEYSGIRQIVEELYPDRAHFIYELLQNAEDTGATEVNFTLQEDALIFEHNGRPFNEKDLEGITNIGKGAKGDQEDKIGRFGIGFKAVFAYTETPFIWSPTYSFKITDLVLPSEIFPARGLGQVTRFEFPFNNPKKPCEIAYAEIAEGLNELAETALLFLRNIELIGWKLCDNVLGEILRIQHTDNHVEVLKQVGDKGTFSSHFLHFSTPIEIEGRPIQSVSVAYQLELLPNVSSFDPRKALSKQLKIVPANPGRVAVFFPAEKETSGLRFHLHAPFVPELSRASIKETKANDPLFDQIAKLAASSLHSICDLHLLTGEFLSVLPNPQDTLPKRYDPIRQAIIEGMKSNPLTPTFSKSHEPARHLLQAKASLKELLSEKDLEFLIEHEDEPPKWAIAASQRNSNQDRFLEGLAIKSWDVDQFVTLLIEKTSVKENSWEKEPNENFMIWLSAKPVEWHQQMYALLYADLTARTPYYRQQQLNRLLKLKIVRLGDGSYSTGKCFFPGDVVEHDDILPRVDKSIYSSGRSKQQQEDAKKFLTEIGVREVGEAEEVERILKARYTSEKFSPNFKDLIRFTKLVDKDPSKAKIFGEYFIFKRTDDKWGTPSQVFIDSPFLETGLSAYYNTLNDDSTTKALSDSYSKCGVANGKLVQFSIAVGVVDKLHVSEIYCSENPEWNYLSGDPGRYGDRINDDFTIENLDELFKFPSVDLSRLIWRTMNALDSKYLCATYRKSRKGGARYADSQLVHLLRNAAWVPQRDNRFERPCDASREQLPKGFSFDEGQEWLTKVHFGESLRMMDEEYKKHREIYSSLGIPAEIPEYLNRLTQEERKTEIEDLKKYFNRKEEARKQLKQINQKIIPYHEALNMSFSATGKQTSNDNEQQAGVARNPDKRRDKTMEDILAAIENEGKSEDRILFTLKKKWKGKNDQVRISLMEWYNGFCQICGKTFTQRNGEPYFEGLYLVPYTTAEWLDRVGNVLCLCPWHSAKFQFGAKEIAEDMIQQIMRFKALAEGGKGHPAIRMKLCGEPIDISYVENHFIDLQEMIMASQSEKKSDEK